jgi:hypothetical protein
MEMEKGVARRSGMVHLSYIATNTGILLRFKTRLISFSPCGS